MLECSLDGLLGLGRVAQVNADHFNCAAICLCQTFLKALAAQCKSGVTDLLVDTEGVLDTSSTHFQTTANASLFLGLPDVNQHPQALSDIRARVDRDHRNTGSYSCFNRGAKACRIGDRDNESIGVGSHCRINEMGHRYHIEGA